MEDATGRELWTHVWPLRQPGVLPAGAGIVARAENFGGTNTGIMELKSRDMMARMNGQTGKLTKVERAGKKFSLNHGPRVVTSGSALKKVAWQLRDDGWLQCDYTYVAAGAQETFGVAFVYPETLVKGKLWLGSGPYRVWNNRLPGTTLGVWEMPITTPSPAIVAGNIPNLKAALPTWPGCSCRRPRGSSSPFPRVRIYSCKC